MERIGGFLMDVAHIARYHLFATLVDAWPELAIDVLAIVAIAALVLWWTGEFNPHPRRDR